MAVNIVEILVRAKDMTAEGFAAADESTSKLGQHLGKIGMIAAGAFAVAGAEALKMAIGFNAVTERLVTQAGVSQSKLAALRAGVLALAGQVGFSPDSLAESIYHAASNMQSMGATSAQMLKVVKVAAEGAKVGNADLVDVTNALTSAVASGIPGVKNYAQAMGALNAIVGTGDMTMQNLAEALSTGLLPVMKGYGLALRDVGAALATFGDLNIRGQQAATELRMAVQAMAVPAKAGQKDFLAMGMSVTRLAQDMRTGGLLKALTDLQRHYQRAGITGTKVGEQLTKDFGKKAGVGLAVLMENLDRLKSKYPDLARGANQFGSAWAKTKGLLSTQLSQLNEGFQALMITMGEKLLPVVQRVVGWMLKHKTTTELLLAAVAALAAGLGVLAAATWAVNTAMDANPIMLVVLAVIALAAGLVYAYHRFGTFRRIVNDVFEWVRHNWPLVVGVIVGPIGLAVAEVVDHWHTLSRVTIGVIHRVIGWVKGHWPVLAGILIGPIGFAVAEIIAHWHQITAATARMWHDVTGLFHRLAHDVLAVLAALPGQLYSMGVRMIESLLGGIGSRVSGAVSTIAGWGHDLLSALGSPFGIHFSEPSEATQVVKMGRRITGDLAKTVGAGAMPTVAGLPRLAAGGAGGRGQRMELVVSAGSGMGSELSAALLQWLRFEVRVQGGGDVQAALGD